jgi:hypothetical protein
VNPERLKKIWRPHAARCELSRSNARIRLHHDFVKILGVALDVPVFTVDFNDVAKLEFDAFKGLVTQCAVHYCVTSLSLELSNVSQTNGGFISQVAKNVKQNLLKIFGVIDMEINVRPGHSNRTMIPGMTNAYRTHRRLGGGERIVGVLLAREDRRQVHLEA